MVAADRPMRILFLVHNVAYKGGAYYRAQSFTRYLVAQGHEVTLMAISENRRFAFEEKQVDGFRLVNSPDLLWGIGRTGWDPWDTFRRCQWIRRHPVDIVHTVDTRPAVVLPALYARRRHGARFIADWTDWWGHGGASSERSSQLVSKVLGPLELHFEEHYRPYADGTVAISHALFDRAKNLGIDESTMLYLPTGCDTHGIQATDMQDARQQLGLDPEATYIGYLGNIYQTDADLMSAAMSKLTSDARLIMVGNFKADMDPALESSGRLLRTGHVSFQKMLLNLSACNALVLPLTDSIANRGRWPSKINDYLAVGRPVVSCAVGDLTDLFQGNDIGRLTEANAEAFAQGIDAVLSDEDAMLRMGNNARMLAEQSLSTDAVSAKLEDFYRQCLNDPS